MIVVRCQHCGVEFSTQRRTRKFCSRPCSNRSAWLVTKTRQCRHCGGDFEVNGVRDANRQHCSRQCAKNHSAKTVRSWQVDNPEMMKVYRQNQMAKNPSYGRDRAEKRRRDILELLGGACRVCGVTNPHWLHVDFIPTSRGIQYRHPRHFAYVSQHVDLFRILCANHHYELTITGKIDGTGITQ
jgi:hypothetical protein